MVRPLRHGGALLGEPVTTGPVESPDPPASGDPADALDALDPVDPLDPLDPRGLRRDAPLFDAYLQALGEPRTPFIVPGHKRRPDLLGPLVMSDLPLSGGVDDVKTRGHLLPRAQERAARLWRADVCHFSTGGSTHANQAMLLATVRPGEQVVVPRTLHRSLLSALVLTGAEPVWVLPDVDPVRGLPSGVRADQVGEALRRAAGAVAVVTGDPGYVGTLGELPATADVAHAHGVPLLVDAAWAAHLGFSRRLPRHALQLGADVMVTSIHKALPGYSQAAVVLARTERVDPARLAAAVETSLTTSPAGSVLATIDASRALLERDGEELLDRLVDLVAEARQRLGAVPGVHVLDGPDVDPAKLVVQLPGTGADGVAVEADLIARGIALEMADRDTLVAMVTLADGPEEVDRLVTELTASLERRRGTPRPVVGSASWTVRPERVLLPREAFFADHEVVAAGAAVGRVSAELVAPYPPGVPVLAPGERITAEAIDALREARDAGTRIAYAADPALRTLRVIA